VRPLDANVSFSEEWAGLKETKSVVEDFSEGLTEYLA